MFVALLVNKIFLVVIHVYVKLTSFKGELNELICYRALISVHLYIHVCVVLVNSVKMLHLMCAIHKLYMHCRMNSKAMVLRLLCRLSEPSFVYMGKSKINLTPQICVSYNTMVQYNLDFSNWMLNKVIGKVLLKTWQFFVKR